MEYYHTRCDGLYVGWVGKEKIHNEKIKVSLKEDVDYSIDARRKDGHTDG